MRASILGFLVVVFVLALVGSPLVLVLYFPQQADAIAQISQTLIPWLLIAMLIMAFHEGIKALAQSLVEAIGRMKRAGIGSTVIELGTQQSGGSTFTREEIEYAAEAFQKLAAEKEVETRWAWHYYFAFLDTTFYGSQFELLESLLDDGPKDPAKLVDYYNIFLSRFKKSTYEYAAWLNFLVSNSTIVLNSTTSLYEITSQGKAYVEDIKGRNYTAASFAN